MMKLSFNTLVLWAFLVTAANHAAGIERQGYVVYMGSAAGASKRILRNSHINMLASAVGSFQLARESLIYSYTKAINGFSALISQREAQVISSMAGVISVFPSRMHQLHTTRSWDFINSYASSYNSILTSKKPPKNSDGSSDVIIGMLDTGIWPEAASFRDDGMDPIPSRWKGKCVDSSDFNSTNCNRKLIGARFYGDEAGFSVEPHDFFAIYENHDKKKKKLGSARDTIGHGTHTASTAGGRAVENASYYGLATGTARGGSPLARIAVYKVCGSGGCADTDILKAFDEAITDPVDILSLSLGASSFAPPRLLTDSISLGAFHAVQNGILVVCSAGNDGPFPYTVVNYAPWILTVGASTIDRTFQSKVILGNNKQYEGIGMNYLPLQDNELYDLVAGGDIAAPEVSNDSASHCDFGSLDATKAKGKIVLCLQAPDDEQALSKSIGVKMAGGAGVIFTGYVDKYFPSLFEVAATVVSNSSGNEILEYMQSTSDAKATILPAETVVGVKPAPMVATFSGRGPSKLTENIIKPDVTAPGVNILAAWTQDSPYTAPPEGQNASAYAIISGTSMACPHVTGISALLKGTYPKWPISAFKSAIMTTARRVDNDHANIRNSTGGSTTWLDTGSGELNPAAAMDPGLVFVIEPAQYCLFLCYYGINSTQVSQICPGSSCPPESNSTDLISTLNYPSMAVDSLGATRTLTRTLTNVGPAESTYTASVAAPPGVSVSVKPQTLEFTAAGASVSVDVQLSPMTRGERRVVGDDDAEYVFGSINFSDGKHNVVMPLAVKI